MTLTKEIKRKKANKRKGANGRKAAKVDAIWGALSMSTLASAILLSAHFLGHFNLGPDATVMALGAWNFGQLSIVKFVLAEKYKRYPWEYLTTDVICALLLGCAYSIGG